MRITSRQDFSSQPGIGKIRKLDPMRAPDGYVVSRLIALDIRATAR